MPRLGGTLRCWSIAHPTDFCYGDCVWGLENQPVPLTIAEWIELIFRREEMEYQLPGDDEHYHAAPVNRFRGSWYDVHLACSFWRVTETTKSVHTFMKTPGAYGYASACAHITPTMMADVMMRSHERGGSQPCNQCWPTRTYRSKCARHSRRSTRLRRR